jgi:hypothetical protein
MLCLVTDAGHATLRDLSRTSNASSPKVWQIELIDHVPCCSSAIRTRPAQKNAAGAPFQDIDQRPPASGGSSSEAAVSRGNACETLRIPRSASKSGQNRCRDVWFRSKRADPFGFWTEIERGYLAGARSHAYVPGGR